VIGGLLWAVWLQFVAMRLVSHGLVGLVGGTVGGRRWCFLFCHSAFVGIRRARRACVTCMQVRFGWLFGTVVWW